MIDNHPIYGYAEHHPECAEMTDIDYRLLEKLLGKLAMQFNDKYAVSITPYSVHDSYSIGLYDRETGKHLKHAIGMDIKDAVKKLQ